MVPKICPNNIISIEEEERLNKSWKKTLIIKLLGKKISFRALESKLYQFWAREGILEIIDLSNNYYMVKFSSYYDYDFALTSGPQLIYDHYLIVKL